MRGGSESSDLFHGERPQDYLQDIIAVAVYG